MILVPRLLAALALCFLASSAYAADKSEFRPKPETYICPNASAFGVDCFLDAVEHLYTMCRQVKSIEIIEFGYEQAEQGVNGAKSEYCVDKHKGSMARPYQAALKEASGSRAALEGLRGLHAFWLASLAGLKWQPPESDSEYQGRVAKAYDQFTEMAGAVRTALTDYRTAHAKPAKPAAKTAKATQRAGR